MQELIKKRWVIFISGILIAIIGLLGIGLILYCNGYRIVYPEQFETSWGAVSGFAAWFGVAVSILSAGASFLAIWSAIQVADKQNKIALFEKRHEIFEIIFNCKPFSEQILDAKCNLDIQLNFYVAFCYTVLNDDKAKDRTFLMAKYLMLERNLNRVPFLFKNTEILIRIPELNRALNSVISVSFNKKEAPDLHERIKCFSDYVNGEDYKKLVEEMQKELILR